MPSVAVQMAGDNMVSTNAVTSPIVPPQTTPLVVQPRHSTLITSTGKLPDAARAKARLTMKATFCVSNNMPSRMASAARTSTVRRDTRNSSSLVAFPFLITEA